jgi:hypothetical protein
MRLTKNIITREEALAICPGYVAWIESKGEDRYDLFEPVMRSFEQPRKGQTGVTYFDGQYVRITVTSVDNDCIQAVDGPVVRVGNGEATWRCDGDKYAYLDPIGTAACRKAVDAVLAGVV